MWQAKATWAWEATTAAEAAHVTTVLDAETFAPEGAMAR
jgi:hypothetical protein